MKRRVGLPYLGPEPIVIITAASVTVVVSDRFQRWTATVPVPQHDYEMEVAA